MTKPGVLIQLVKHLIENEKEAVINR